MNLLCFLFVVIRMYQCAVHASDLIDYKYAQNEDIYQLVNFINTDACNASQQIVVVPENFRYTYVQSGVDSGLFFIAKQADSIVGFKKLFLVDDQQELQDLLCKEIRCKNGRLLAQGVINIIDQSLNVRVDRNMDHVYNSSAAYVYNGADFTKEIYRGKGVNSVLTEYALSYVKERVIAHIIKNKSAYIVMLFGLTNDNAGSNDKLLAGRSKAIAKLFGTFVQDVAVKMNKQIATDMLAARYLAYKPSFDPKSKKCIPLSDDQSIQGCGCVLACKLIDREILC